MMTSRHVRYVKLNFCPFHRLKPAAEKDGRLPKNVNLLIVDDEPLICSNLEKGLHFFSENYNIQTAGDPDSALHILKNSIIDVLISDIILPGLNGIQLMIEATRIHPGLETILITGNGNLETSIRALRGGAANFIQKPVSFELLHDSIQKCLQKQFFKQQLQNSERRYRMLAETVQAGIAFLDTHEIFIYTNPYFLNTIGADANSVSQLKMDNIFLDLDPGTIIDLKAQEFQENASFVSIESRIQNINGSQRHVLLHISPTYTSDAEYSGLMLMMTDISHRKNTEQKLRANLDFIYSVVDALSDALITSDNQGQIVYLNPAAEKLLGYTKEELLTKNLTSLIPYEHRAQHAQGLQELTKSRLSRIVGKPIRTVALTRNNDELPIQLIIAISESNGQVFLNSVIRKIDEYPAGFSDPHNPE